MTREEKLQDIKDHPDRHQHQDLGQLTNCCMRDGVLDLSLMDAHSQYVDMGSNGGVKCDVHEGPCSCGAWH